MSRHSGLQFTSLSLNLRGCFRTNIQRKRFFYSEQTGPVFRVHATAQITTSALPIHAVFECASRSSHFAYHTPGTDLMNP